MMMIEVDERGDTEVEQSMNTVDELGPEIKPNTQLSKLRKIKTKTSQKLN